MAFLSFCASLLSYFNWPDLNHCHNQILPARPPQPFTATLKFSPLFLIHQGSGRAFSMTFLSFYASFLLYLEWSLLKPLKTCSSLTTLTPCTGIYLALPYFLSWFRGSVFHGLSFILRLPSVIAQMITLQFYPTLHPQPFTPCTEIHLAVPYSSGFRGSVLHNRSLYLRLLCYILNHHA